MTYENVVPTPLLRERAAQLVAEVGEDVARAKLELSREALARLCAGFPLGKKTVTIARKNMIGIVPADVALALKAEAYDAEHRT